MLYVVAFAAGLPGMALLAAAGPWDAVVQFLVIVGGLASLALSAWIATRAAQAAASARRSSRAAVAVTSGLDEVRQVLGPPSEGPSLVETLSGINSNLARMATTQSEHAAQDLRFHDEARAVFERQSRINERTRLQLEALRLDVEQNGDATRKAAEAAGDARDIARAALAEVQALAGRVARLEPPPPDGDG